MNHVRVSILPKKKEKQIKDARKQKDKKNEMCQETEGNWVLSSTVQMAR